MFKTLRFYLKKFVSKIEQYQVGSYEINKQLVSHGCTDIYITDKYYKTGDYSNVKPLIEVVPFKYRRYIPERFDCDNFAFSFFGLVRYFFPELPVGICFVDIKSTGEKHALNFVFYKKYNGELDFMYIEPQSNKIFFTEDYQMYLAVI